MLPRWVYLLAVFIFVFAVVALMSMPALPT